MCTLLKVWARTRVTKCECTFSSVHTPPIHDALSVVRVTDLGHGASFHLQGGLSVEVTGSDWATQAASQHLRTPKEWSWLCHIDCVADLSRFATHCPPCSMSCYEDAWRWVPSDIVQHSRGYALNCALK